MNMTRSLAPRRRVRREEVREADDAELQQRRLVPARPDAQHVARRQRHHHVRHQAEPGSVNPSTRATFTRRRNGYHQSVLCCLFTSGKVLCSQNKCSTLNNRIWSQFVALELLDTL